MKEAKKSCRAELLTITPMSELPVLLPFAGGDTVSWAVQYVCGASAAEQLSVCANEPKVRMEVMLALAVPIFQMRIARGALVDPSAVGGNVSCVVST